MANLVILECQFLIPLRRDRDISDGELHDRTVWRWLEDELFDHFDGYGKARESHDGAWRSRLTGKRTRDVSRRFFVALPKKRLNELRAILRQACIRFAQQCIYLSIAGIVEFVEAEK
jgi:hypothetical protein